MPKNKEYLVTYRLEEIDIEQLKRLLKEITSLTGLEPVSITDQTGEEIK